MEKYAGFDEFFKHMLERQCYNIANRPKGDFPMSFLAVCMNRNGVAMASDSKYIEYTKENGAVVEIKEYFDAKKVFWNDHFAAGIVGQTSRVLKDGSCERIDSYVESAMRREGITPSLFVRSLKEWFDETDTLFLEETHLDIVIIQQADEMAGFPYEAIIYYINRKGIHRKEIISREICFYMGEYSCCNKELVSYFSKFNSEWNSDRLQMFCENSVWLVKDIGDKIVSEKQLSVNTVGGETQSLLFR